MNHHAVHSLKDVFEQICKEKGNVLEALIYARFLYHVWRRRAVWYRDLIELRKNRWVPRRAEEKAKTMQEVMTIDEMAISDVWYGNQILHVWLGFKYIIMRNGMRWDGREVVVCTMYGRDKIWNET